MYVYLIQAGSKRGAIKIGVARSPDKRLATLQTGNHLDLRVLALIPCETRLKAEELERWLHYRLERFNIRGEWFNKKLSLKEVHRLSNLKGFSMEEIPTKTNAETMNNETIKKQIIVTDCQSCPFDSNCEAWKKLTRKQRVTLTISNSVPQNFILKTCPLEDLTNEQ